MLAKLEESLKKKEVPTFVDDRKAVEKIPNNNVGQLGLQQN